MALRSVGLFGRTKEILARGKTYRIHARMDEEDLVEADGPVDSSPDAEPSASSNESLYTVKCSLGRLGCTPALREKIESVVRRVHILALRGTHLATELLYRAVRTGGTLPAVDSQTWWYRVIIASGTLDGRGIPAEMTEAAATLFGSQTPVDMTLIWPFVASLAKELRTETYTMLRQNIHREISKAVHRIVILWETRTSTSLHRDAQEDRKLLSEILRYAERRGTRHRDAPEYPEGAPGDLKLLLDAEIDDWHRLFQELLPCPTPKFLTKYSKTKPLLAWTLRLQRQRRSCLDEVSARLGSEELAVQRLGAMGRAVRFLPLCSFHVRPIGIYPTSLGTLLASLRSDTANGSRKRKRDDEEAPVVDFWSHFPGARRLTQPNGNSVRKLYPFIRCDGVSASVTCRRPAVDARGTGPRTPFPMIVLDCLPGGGQPPIPGPADRLVAVDPGRRDMITAVFSDQAKAPLVVSTRGFHRKTRTSTAAVITKWSLDKADADLRSKLEDLPSSRCFETWASYLAAVLPLVKLRVEALQRKCVRRARFMNYMRRDREIDRICQDLCGNQPTIVAFGAANACSTGFGYAPAPQSRLRHRLRHVHGARVCLVDEYKTSQLCCGCGGQLGLVREPGRRAPVWHVKRCSFCRNGRGAPGHMPGHMPSDKTSGSQRRRQHP